MKHSGVTPSTAGIKCEGPLGFTLYAGTLLPPRSRWPPKTFKSFVGPVAIRHNVQFVIGRCRVLGTCARENSPTLGRNACYTDSDGYNWILWTDHQQLTVDWLAPRLGRPGRAIGHAWRQLVA